jgi:small subunit ribosomal protein S4
MILAKKQRYKPFYKQFLRLRKNVQNRPKLFKFNKQKWERLQNYSKKQLKFYKRFKIQDQFKLSVTKFASRGNAFQKNFRNNLYERKTFNLFYGGLRRKYLKSHINAIKNKKHKHSNFQNFRHYVLQFFESRLDTVLYRANFALSIKSARQLIFHGHVLINGSAVRTQSYILKTDDLIEIASNKKSRELIRKNIDRSNFWPIPPKYLVINYRTLQVIFVYGKNLNLLPAFTYYLNVDSIITNINRY